MADSRRMKGRIVAAIVLLGFIGLAAFGAQPPAWVGPVTFKWNAQIGGGMWYQEAQVITNVAPVLAEYPRPVMVGLRSDVAENGYRFDLNRFDSSAEPYNYWPDRASQEFVLQTFERTGNVRFIWSMPTPDKYHDQPYSVAKTGAGYPWQTPEYYAAYLQYLTEPPSMEPAQYNRLALGYDFFLSAPRVTNAVKTQNALAERELKGNWGNLRARRGHPAPYAIDGVILGIEPYGDAQEVLPEGKQYGAIAERFRVAIRARAGVAAKIPLGLNVAAGGAVSDFQRTWFKPMLDTVKREDFSYLDLYHHYRFGVPTNELNRIYPTLVHAGSAGATSPGWQNWWDAQSTWVSDFSRYLWIYEDTRSALRLYGENPARWKIGCTEHGMTITSRFSGNDMGSGIHWGLWLAEIMRYNADYDMNWVLTEQGMAHAQMHFRDKYVTRTPGHYVYKMAQEFVGLDYCTNTFQSPTVATGTMPEGGNYKSDDVVVRVFKNSTNGNYHLFVVNKHATNAASITGWESWTVAKWDQIRATNFTAQNPIGAPWNRESVKTVSKLGQVAGNPLNVEPISVNHIELTATTNTLPVVFVEWQQDGKENPQMPGLVRVARNGSTNAALTVKCKFAGTAGLGLDYTLASTNSVTIPAGSAYVDVEVQTKTDTILESPEYATLILTPDANYNVGAPTSASVYIVD
jgi:hypothetical protein